MKLIITSVLLSAISEANRLLHSAGCESFKFKCGTGGPCFDNPYTQSPICCPADEICPSIDYYKDETIVVCDDNNLYDNKCYAYCSGRKPDTCAAICKCNTDTDCDKGYICLETPYGFAGCDQNTRNSCFGFCVAKAVPCTNTLDCAEHERCFINPGVGYCGSLPSQCVSSVMCPADAQLCQDGSYVGRVPPHCEFDKCPEPNINYCGGYDHCQKFYDGCNECDCGGDGSGLGWPLRCTEKACDPRTMGRSYCIECVDGYILNKETGKCRKPIAGDDCGTPGTDCAALMCFSGECPDGTCWGCCQQCTYEANENGELICAGRIPRERVCPPIVCPTDVYQCPDGLVVRRDLLNGCKFPHCPSKCELVDCLPDNSCYDTSQGAICCNPESCESSACGGFTGVKCKSGYECVNDPHSKCELTELGCQGVCIFPDKWLEVTTTEAPTLTCANVFCGPGSFCYDLSSGPACCDPDICAAEFCGGIAAIPCSKGYECVNDPLLPCDPSTTSDCGGICVNPNAKVYCGGFDNCESYNDGCNDCECGPNGFDACTERFCPHVEEFEPTAKCIRCQKGYTLFKNECIKIPTKPGLEVTTLPPGCASLLCPIGTKCCDDGFGGVACCLTDTKCGKKECKNPFGRCAPVANCFANPCEVNSCSAAASCETNFCGGCYAIWKDANGNIIPADKCEERVETCCVVEDRPLCFEGSACCPDGSWSCSIGDGVRFSCGGETLDLRTDKFGDICEETDKVSCQGIMDCDYAKNGYICRPDPECVGNTGLVLDCWESKVCLDIGGKCRYDDMGCDKGYSCILINDKFGFCVKYQ